MASGRITFDLDELEAELTEETRAILVEVGNELVNNLKVEAPVGATGDLRRSFQIFRRGQNEVVLGSRLDYAKAVNDGRGPHTPDFEAIQVWARRKLGSEAAAGPVWRHIAREGTEPNPYIDRAVDATLDSFR
jgi:hypothetical protein